MRIDEPTSILVFRNGSIGNTLVALPAIRALKEKFPDASLTVVLDSTGAELLQHTQFIDRIICYDKHGNDKGLAAHSRLMLKLRKLRPSHSVLFKRFFRNGLLGFLSGSKYRIGFRTDGSAPFLNYTIPYDESIHVAQLNMNLLALIGIQSHVQRYAISLSEQDRNEARRAINKIVSQGKRFAVIHYGGSTTRPDFFPAERMKELLQPFVESNIELIFIGAGTQERGFSETAVRKLEDGKLLFDLPIRVMAAVVEEAGCFIGFNSGPAHIAAGVQTPGIVIYRPDLTIDQEIRKWKPLSDGLIPVVPPGSSNETEWHRFMEDAHHRITALISVFDSGKS